MPGDVRYGRSLSVLKSGRRTPKVLCEGTHRSQNVEITLRHVLRLAPVMGITRVANVTGLDSVGIPVVMVCRPNSRSLAVSQGKGIDLASARASGLMEAAELYHAETTTLPLRLATYEELRYQHDVVEVDELPQESGSRFQPNLRLLWCEGSDLLSGENVFVPYEMVHTNYTTPFPDGHGCFTASSNGLASGNRLVEAISQAICEVIERDATTLWK
jgi:YcaO-like protein with predicted kinase domain